MNVAIQIDGVFHAAILWERTLDIDTYCGLSQNAPTASTWPIDHKSHPMIDCMTCLVRETQEAT